MANTKTSTESAVSLIAQAATISLGWQMTLLAALTFAVCYLRMFVLPHTPLLLWGDALGYATKGVRLLDGELPYRDFFEFLPPGTDLVYALVFRCLGVSIWAMHLVMATLAALTALWMTWCASRLVRGWFVLLPAVLLMGWVLSYSLDPTHHWFSTVALMGVVWILFNGHSIGRVAGAGVFCGVAASFTQTKGAAAIVGLVVYFIWIAVREKNHTERWWRRGLVLSLVLCGSALATFMVINGPYILAAGVGRWAWDVMVFPSRYFGSVSGNNWTGAVTQFVEYPARGKWIIFPFQFFVAPLTYVWFFVKLRRAKAEPEEPWNQLVLIAVVGIAMLAAVAPAMFIRRFSIASPPAMLLLTWLLSKSGKVRTALSLGAASVVIAAVQIAGIQLGSEQILDLPVGRVAVPPRTEYYDIYRWMAANTKPGQWYFGLPTLTLPLELRNPTPMAEMTRGEYTRPEQVAAIVQGIERVKVPVIVMRRLRNTPSSWDQLPDHLQPFRDELRLHYRNTITFPSGDEIWQRVDK
jgi:hypothetical protein